MTQTTLQFEGLNLNANEAVRMAVFHLAMATRLIEIGPASADELKQQVMAAIPDFFGTDERWLVNIVREATEKWITVFADLYSEEENLND